MSLLELVPDFSRTYEFCIERRTVIRDKQLYELKKDEYPETIHEIQTYIVTKVEFNLLNAFNPKYWYDLHMDDIILILKYIPPRSLHLLAYYYGVDFIFNLLKAPCMGSFLMEIDKKDKSVRTKLHTNIKNSGLKFGKERKCFLTKPQLNSIDITFPFPIYSMKPGEIEVIWKSIIVQQQGENQLKDVIDKGIEKRSFHRYMTWKKRKFVPFKSAIMKIKVYPEHEFYLFVCIEEEETYMNKWGLTTCSALDTYRWNITNFPDQVFCENFDVIAFYC